MLFLSCLFNYVVTNLHIICAFMNCPQYCPVRVRFFKYCLVIVLFFKYCLVIVLLFKYCLCNCAILRVLPCNCTILEVLPCNCTIHIIFCILGCQSRVCGQVGRDWRTAGEMPQRNHPPAVSDVHYHRGLEKVSVFAFLVIPYQQKYYLRCGLWILNIYYACLLFNLP